MFFCRSTDVLFIAIVTLCGGNGLMIAAMGGSVVGDGRWCCPKLSRRFSAEC
jgi:tRNA A37 threonylcarbamoyltransferase TsaD